MPNWPECLSVRLRTKWFWVRAQLHVINLFLFFTNFNLVVLKKFSLTLKKCISPINFFEVCINRCFCQSPWSSRNIDLFSHISLVILIAQVEIALAPVTSLEGPKLDPLHLWTLYSVTMFWPWFEYRLTIVAYLFSSGCFLLCLLVPYFCIFMVDFGWAYDQASWCDFRWGTFKETRWTPTLGSRHREVIFKKAALKNLAKFRGKRLCWSLFFIKVESPQPAVLSR